MRSTRLLAAAVASAALLVPAAGAAPAPVKQKHVFPVQAHWTDRGPIGDFGAPRDGGRTHEGFDIVAKCGAKLVAVTDGKVIRRGFDPVLYGNYLLIGSSTDANRAYFYAHLIRPAAVKVGERVGAGQFVGNEGKTGNAETVGCHLHFEIHDHGTPINPEPLVRKWAARESGASSSVRLRRFGVGRPPSGAAWPRLRLSAPLRAAR